VQCFGHGFERLEQGFAQGVARALLQILGHHHHPTLKVAQCTGTHCPSQAASRPDRWPGRSNTERAADFGRLCRAEQSQKVHDQLVDLAFRDAQVQVLGQAGVNLIPGRTVPEAPVANPDYQLAAETVVFQVQRLRFERPVRLPAGRATCSWTTIGSTDHQLDPRRKGAAQAGKKQWELYSLCQGEPDGFA